MGERKCLVVVVVAAVCLSLANAETRLAVGWCCPARKDGGDGCPGASAGHFQPRVIPGGNYTVTVTWKTRGVTCPPTSTLVYHDNATTPNHLSLPDQEDELILSYFPLDLFEKQTRNYCLEQDGNEYRMAVCQPDRAKICGSGVCIPKCCGEGEAIENFYMCTRNNESTPLQFYSAYGEPVPSPASVVTVGDRVPDCKDGFPSPVTENYNLLVNGQLLESEDQVFYDFDQYCIENSYDAEGEVSEMVLRCISGESNAITTKYELMKVGYIISDVFLIITILFHVFIPSIRDAQGLILLSHMVSMLVALTVLFTLSIFSKGLSKAFCIFNGFLFQYSFLAMFFWLNIMCFDIWRVIRATARGIPLLGILSNDAKKFRLYCLYGWGCPLVISIVTGIMHALPEELAKEITRPGFGKLSCWLPGDLEHLIYCYAYVAGLFILDLIFIGHTIIMLYQAGSAFSCFARQVSVTTFNRKHLEAFWQRLSVFVLMVFCWTTEILSWKIHPREIWIVTDFINSLQGFIIFLIFISSKKRRDLVKELLQKVTTCFPRLSSQARPSVSSQVAAWNVNSPSTSISGPSGSTGEESCSKTDGKENN